MSFIIYESLKKIFYLQFLSLEHYCIILNVLFPLDMKHIWLNHFDKVLPGRLRIQTQSYGHWTNGYCISWTWCKFILPCSCSFLIWQCTVSSQLTAHWCSVYTEYCCLSAFLPSRTVSPYLFIPFFQMGFFLHLVLLTLSEIKWIFTFLGPLMCTRDTH